MSRWFWGRRPSIRRGAADNAAAVKQVADPGAAVKPAPVKRAAVKRRRTPWRRSSGRRTARWRAAGRRPRRRVYQQVACRERARCQADVAGGGLAKRVPAGSRLVIQIHYTATGAPQEDQCSIGLVFADPKTVRKEVVTDMVVNPRFEIPPGDPNYKVEAERVLEEDEEVLGIDAAYSRARNWLQVRSRCTRMARRKCC